MKLPEDWEYEEQERWRPNWNDENEYSCFVEDLSLQGWAWEFVRRNPEYHLFWREEVDCFRQSDAWLREMAGSPESEGTVTESSHEDRVIEMGFRHAECQKRWGFYPAFSPAWPAYDLPKKERPYPPIFTGQLSTRLAPGRLFDLKSLRSRLEEREPEETDQRLRAAMLDLGVVIETQIEFIAKLAREEQRRCGITSPSTPQRPSDDDRKAWTLYLRVLDAHAVGARPDDIAPELFADHPSPDGKHRETLRQAEEKIQPRSYLKFLGYSTSEYSDPAAGLEP